MKTQKVNGIIIAEKMVADFDKIVTILKAKNMKKPAQLLKFSSIELNNETKLIEIIRDVTLKT